MEYRVIETALHTRKSLVSRLLIFLFGSVTPRFQSNPLQFELEAILNQMVRQGYSLVSQQLAAVTTNQGEMFVKAKPHSLAPKIFKRLKLDMPGNISTKNDLISCFKLDEDVFPLQMTFL